MLSRTDSVVSPFSGPLLVNQSHSPESSATVENSSPIQSLPDVAPMTPKSDESDMLAFEKQKLLRDYKVTLKKRIKLFLKHTYRGAVKGSKVGGVLGLIGGTLGALFTMHITAIPVGTGIGLAAGAGIGGAAGAIKGLRTVRNLTPQTLLQDKIDDAAAHVKKAQETYTKAANRADGLFLKARRKMGFGVDYPQPTHLTHTHGLEEHLNENITTRSALEKPSSKDKSDLKALKDLKKQLDKMNPLKQKLDTLKGIETVLQSDLELISEKVDADTLISDNDSPA